MTNNDIRLSKTSTEMIQDILDNIRSENCNSVDSPLLLYELLNARDENDNNILEDYFRNEGIEVDNVELIIFNSKPSENEEKTPSVGENVDEKTSELFFIDYEGNKLLFPANSEVSIIYDKLFEIVVNWSVSKIEPLHFIIAMFMADNQCLKDFLANFALSYWDAKKYFKPERILKLVGIPFSLTGFLSLMNDRADITKPCEILMRDKETDALWNIMLKKNKRNAVIVGEAGVGKTAIVEKISYEIKKGTCPKEFMGFRVLSLDVNALIAGTTFRGQAEERIKDIVDFLEKNNDVILFIDEVHTILGAGSCFQGEMDLANALKPILARGDTIVIGATTSEEYEKYFSKDAALTRRFEKIEVKEPMAKNVYPMIKNKIQSLSDFHNVKIKKSMVEFVIMIAGCFNVDKKNPDKTLDLIDRAMVSAKRSNKKWVDKASVLKNFSISFEKWDKMSESSKLEVAYHEVGHYIVAKASECLIDYNYLAISILPTENYTGVTVFEENQEVVAFYNTQYYIDSIALDLGGRVAEQLLTSVYTSGASADLQSATTTAFMYVTKLGMCDDSFKNRIYLNTENYPMFSEKATNKINKEVNKLIEKAFNRAEELVNANKDILEAIVSALLKNRIMSEAELDKIWQDVISKRKKD